jgi:hypothetical protein
MITQEQKDAIARILGPKKGEKNHNGRKNTKAVDRHIWSIANENLAIQLYRNRAEESEILEAIKGTELKLSSMKMKLSNLRYLDTGEGLANVSETTRILWGKAQKVK